MKSTSVAARRCTEADGSVDSGFVLPSFGLNKASLSTELHGSPVMSGTPSLANGLLGVARTHCKQARTLAGMTASQLDGPCTDKCRDAMSETELLTASKTALATAIDFYSVISVDQTPDDIVRDLMKWWDRDGSKFFQCEVEANEDAGACLDPDMVEITEELLNPSVQDLRA